MGLRWNAGNIFIIAAEYYEHGLCVHEKSCPRDGQHRTGASGRWLGAPDRQSCLSSPQKYGSRPRL